MPRSAHDHEIRSYLSAGEYSQLVRLAEMQDRSLSDFIRNGLRRYMDSIEPPPIPRETSPKVRPVSESFAGELGEYAHGPR